MKIDSFQDLLAELQKFSPQELRQRVRVHLPGFNNGEAIELDFITDRHGSKRLPFMKVVHKTSNFLDQLCPCNSPDYHP